jgi:hypothetical protein
MAWKRVQASLGRHKARAGCSMVQGDKEEFKGKLSEKK